MTLIGIKSGRMKLWWRISDSTVLPAIKPGRNLLHGWRVALTSCENVRRVTHISSLELTKYFALLEAPRIFAFHCVRAVAHPQGPVKPS